MATIIPTRTSTPSTNRGKGKENILTGKQEHYLKRELISSQAKFEIAELNSPTALQRFGAPFRSPLGEVAPVDSELPILRYLFVHHVRKFPFLNQAKEKEFWQDRLQVFLELFANKRISSSEDRLEETKRRKLALKCEKVVELMMNSGIPTASGYEERVGFEEIEAAGGADRAAHEGGLLINVPEGNWLNGWDVNIAAVRQVSIKRTVRYHIHAEFLIRTKRVDLPDVVAGRRYGAFVRLHKEIRQEIPGKVLPSLPGKVDDSSTSTYLSFSTSDDRSSVSSSTTTSSSGESRPNNNNNSNSNSNSNSNNSNNSNGGDTKPHGRSQSLGSSLGSSLGFSRSRNASRNSFEQAPIELWREDKRVSLRAFLRALLGDPQIAKSRAMAKFLLNKPTTLNEEERIDEKRRREMDKIRIEEQRRFYEIARQRARELNVYMESFRREIVESNGLTKLFAEIREKDKLEDLSIQYKKFAEWLRIEVAATIYHLFLAEDNSSELFAQGKKIHSLVPYTVLKNVIRLANPAAVMSGVLDLFLATPFGSRSLMQRVLGMAIGDGIKQLQKGIDSITMDIGDSVLCAKLKAFTEADEVTREGIRAEAAADSVDLIIAILRSEYIQPELEAKQVETVFNAYVAWNNAVDMVDDMRDSAQLFTYFKQLLKLYTRQRDKNMMLEMISEPVTLQLFRDLFTIFYEPLIRVYKSANVYNSVTDFAVFVDDMINVVEKAQHQDMSSDPNQTVQAFIDLCARHEDKFYKFVHEVHIHDDGLFENLMGWLEGILAFLRKGPTGGALDMNELMKNAVESKVIDGTKAKEEIDLLIKWHARRRKWHEDKTRQKMASAGEDQTAWLATGPENQFSMGDFGIDNGDADDLNNVDADGISSGEDEIDDQADPIDLERRKRKKKQDHLRRRAGEPEKPVVAEVLELKKDFLLQLRKVLAG